MDTVKRGRSCRQSFSQSLSVPQAPVPLVFLGLAIGVLFWQRKPMLSLAVCFVAGAPPPRERPGPLGPAAISLFVDPPALTARPSTIWTLDPRVYEEPGKFTGCPNGQRNAAESECLAAVQEVTHALGEPLQTPLVKVVDAGADGWVPAGCSYSRGHGLRAMFNRNPAGRSSSSYPLVCIKGKVQVPVDLPPEDRAAPPEMLASTWEEAMRVTDSYATETGAAYGPLKSGSVCDWGSRRDFELHLQGAVIATNARDEAAIVEWVAHHLTIGFDHVLVIDDRSLLPIANLLQEKLPTNLYERTTTLRLCDERPEPLNKMAMQSMFANAAPLLGANWTAYFDADEFLVLPRYASVNKWLASAIPHDTLQVSVNWLSFGSNLLEQPPTDQLMMEAYTRHSGSLSILVKGMVRADTKLRWTLTMPHYYGLDEGSAGKHCAYPPTALANGEAKSDLSRGECYAKFPELREEYGPLGEPCSHWSNWQYYRRKDIGEVSAFLAHYRWQARYICVKRKLLVPRDDNSQYNAPLGRNDSFAKWDSECGHAQDNDVADTIVADRHAKALRRALAQPEPASAVSGGARQLSAVERAQQSLDKIAAQERELQQAKQEAEATLALARANEDNDRSW